MKIGIVGSRMRNSLEDKELIKKEILELDPTLLVSGGCKKGADKFAEELAVELNIPIEVYLPEMKDGMSYYERCACYYTRNRKIVKNSDLLVACLDSKRKGGTDYTVDFAKKNNVVVITI